MGYLYIFDHLASSSVLDACMWLVLQEETTHFVKRHFAHTSKVWAVKGQEDISIAKVG